MTTIYLLGPARNYVKPATTISSKVLPNVYGFSVLWKAKYMCILLLEYLHGSFPYTAHEWALLSSKMTERTFKHHWRHLHDCSEIQSHYLSPLFVPKCPPWSEHILMNCIKQIFCEQLHFSVSSLHNSKVTWKMVHKLYGLLLIIFALWLDVDFHHFHERKKNRDNLHLSFLFTISFKLDLSRFSSIVKTVNTCTPFYHHLWLSLSTHLDFLKATIEHVHAVFSFVSFNAAQQGKPKNNLTSERERRNIAVLI